MEAVDRQYIHDKKISLGDIKTTLKGLGPYLKSKVLIIFLWALTGGALGFIYSLVKKTYYTAIYTFVLDDGSKSIGLGQYAGLASMAGISLNNGGGLFQGDNILELYKSRSMIEKTLLTTAKFNNHEDLLIERYIAYNKLRKKWSDKIDTNIRFKGNPESFQRTQDSIVTNFVEIFNKKYLTVSKPDKKLNIVKVEFVYYDEDFAKEFTNKLVENVNNFYIQTKTKKASQNVQILQKQADSIKVELNKNIYGVASAYDATPNANPSLVKLRVPSQKKQIDVQANSAIYSEVVKNLEISKLSLRQEIPLIQVIDQPVLPLDNNKMGRVTAIVIGCVMAFFLSVTYLVLRKLIG